MESTQSVRSTGTYPNYKIKAFSENADSEMSFAAYLKNKNKNVIGIIYL